MWKSAHFSFIEYSKNSGFRNCLDSQATLKIFASLFSKTRVFWIFKYLIVARLLPQGGSSLSRTYVMLCNTDKHVTDVHYNDPGSKACEPGSIAAQMCDAGTSECLQAFWLMKVVLRWLDTLQDRPTSSGPCLMKMSLPSAICRFAQQISPQPHHQQLQDAQLIVSFARCHMSYRWSSTPMCRRGLGVLLLPWLHVCSYIWGVIISKIICMESWSRQPHCDAPVIQLLVQRIRHDKSSQGTALRCARKQCKQVWLRCVCNLLHMVPILVNWWMR